MSSLLIIGAGGHGKVAADIALESGDWQQVAFLDDKHPTMQSCFGLPVLGAISQANEFISDYPDCLVAIGDNRLRVELLCSLQQLGFSAVTLIHSSAVVSRSAIIDAGSVVFANAVIQADAHIGAASIINTAASVDHDVRLGEGVHVSPGAHLGGGAMVGDCTWIGIGAVVREYVRLGDNVMLGAGAAAVSDISSGVLAIGVPAKVKAARSEW